MKKKHKIILFILVTLLVLPVVIYAAWARPGHSGILVQGQSPEGQEFCVVQTYEVPIEPYRVSLYIRDSNRV